MVKTHTILTLKIPGDRDVSKIETMKTKDVRMSQK
jgi:hypothetical protein